MRSSHHALDREGLAARTRHLCQRQAPREASGLAKSQRALPEHADRTGQSPLPLPQGRTSASAWKEEARKRCRWCRWSADVNSNLRQKTCGYAASPPRADVSVMIRNSKRVQYQKPINSLFAIFSASIPLNDIYWAIRHRGNFPVFSSSLIRGMDHPPEPSATKRVAMFDFRSKSSLESV